MRDYPVTRQNLPQAMAEIESLLADSPCLLITAKDATVGKWGMARLWRSWMQSTAEWMARRGAQMPLVWSNGQAYGWREFNPEDAHELFTHKWLGADSDGNRLSWSRTGRDGMRAATKGERFHALRQHESWAAERGLLLFKPANSLVHQSFDSKEFRLRVNGDIHEVGVPVHFTLLETLRYVIGLTGRGDDLPVITGVDSARFTTDRAYRASLLLEIVALLHDYRGAGLFRR